MPFSLVFSNNGPSVALLELVDSVLPAPSLILTSIVLMFHISSDRGRFMFRVPTSRLFCFGFLLLLLLFFFLHWETYSSVSYFFLNRL